MSLFLHILVDCFKLAKIQHPFFLLLDYLFQILFVLQREIISMYKILIHKLQFHLEKVANQ